MKLNKIHRTMIVLALLALGIALVYLGGSWVLGMVLRMHGMG